MTTHYTHAAPSNTHYTCRTIKHTLHTCRTIKHTRKHQYKYITRKITKHINMKHCTVLKTCKIKKEIWTG